MNLRYIVVITCKKNLASFSFVVYSVIVFVGPHLFHLLTEQIHEFHVALLDSSQLEEFVLQMPSFLIGTTTKTVDEFNTDDVPEIVTSSQQCSDYDALTAVYCIVILKFLLSQKVMADLIENTVDAKDCCFRVTEGMINYQYIFNLANALLWNVQLQKYELLDSEVFIRKAVSSLMSSHRANNQINLSVNELHLQNPESSVIENEKGLESTTFVHDFWETYAYEKDIKESDNGSLTIHSTGRRLKTILPSGTTIAHKCESTRNCEILMSVESAEYEEECMVMEKYQQGSTDCAVTSTIDSYFVDVNSSSEAATSHWTNTCKDELLQVKHCTGDELRTSNVEIENRANHFKNLDFVRTSNYANVPDEWYSLSVDKKYELPYITMIVLQKELNRIKTELSSLPLICVSIF